MSELKQSIPAEIEGRIPVVITFNKEGFDDFFSLYDLGEAQLIKLNSIYKVIPKTKYTQLTVMFDGVKTINDVVHQSIVTDVGFDDFYDVYFNSL
jgi:hypothetical protein